MEQRCGERNREIGAGSTPDNAVLCVRWAELGRQVGGILGVEPGSAEVRGGKERAPVRWRWCPGVPWISVPGTACV